MIILSVLTPFVPAQLAPALFTAEQTDRERPRRKPESNRYAEH
jgi:hypothetical protein